MSELCVDFGTTHTVLVLQEGAERSPLFLPEVGHGHPAVGGKQIPWIPSLVAYPEDDRPLIGDEVVRRGLKDASGTFRWMKHYLLQGRSLRIRLPGGGYRDVRQAAGDFLRQVLALSARTASSPIDTVVFTVPVESTDAYADWLAEVAAEAGFPRSRVVDEATAVALGYGIPLTGGACAVFDFGGDTLDLSIVRWETDSPSPRAVVVGKAGQPTLGGKTLDQWLAEWVVRASGHAPEEPWIRRIGRSLLRACEQAKEELSFTEAATVVVEDGESGRVLRQEITRQQWEEECQGRGLQSLLHQTVRRALASARDRGVREEEIGPLLLAGGSSLIPAVERTLRQAWGADRVQSTRPLDAAAHGAAVFAAGVGMEDRIRHDYALRHWDPVRGAWSYQVLVPAGTPVPRSRVASWTLGATHPGQERLGLEIWQVSRRGEDGPSTELVFDPSGAVQMVSVSPETAPRAERWLNEANPLLIEADPPADPGAERFLVEFGISADRHLLVSVYDRQAGRWLWQERPLARLR